MSKCMVPSTIVIYTNVLCKFHSQRNVCYLLYLGQSTSTYKVHLATNWKKTKLLNNALQNGVKTRFRTLTNPISRLQKLKVRFSSIVQLLLCEFELGWLPNSIDLNPWIEFDLGRLSLIEIQFDWIRLTMPGIFICIPHNMTCTVGLIARLVVHSTGIAEVMNSNPV